MTSIGWYTFNEYNNLRNVYYSGSEKEWEKIEIDWRGNDPLRYAAIHYNSSGPADVLYGDVDRSGTVNARDRTTLARYLAKWQGYGALPHTN